MAKLGFKDIIMKYLKKDEAFKVKYAMNPNQKIAVATYNDKADAEKFVSDIIKKGGKAILTQEDAPANATGTAVAGTGDDSSTVVVKKKKDQQKKLMTRMGITEAINRAIPDLEYPKDEIRERVNQLKQLALGEADPITYGPDKVAKAMAIATKSSGNLTGAVREIEKIAKGLSKVSTIARALKTANEETITEFKKMVVTIADPVKRKKAMDDLESLGREQNVDTGFKIQRLGSRSFKVDGMGADLNKYATDMKNFYGATVKAEDLDAQPQDKDVKKIKGTQPKKYYKKMSPPEKEKRAKFFRKQKYKKSDDDDDYKAAPGDEKAKTKKSIHTKKFDKMYGDSYGYTAMHAKPIAKLNPLRRKDESK